LPQQLLKFTSIIDTYLQIAVP